MAISPSPLGGTQAWPKADTISTPTSNTEGRYTNGRAVARIETFWHQRRRLVDAPELGAAAFEFHFQCFINCEKIIAALFLTLEHALVVPLCSCYFGFRGVGQ